MIYCFLDANFGENVLYAFFSTHLTTPIRELCKTYEANDKTGDSSLDTQKEWESDRFINF